MTTTPPNARLRRLHALWTLAALASSAALLMLGWQACLALLGLAA